jgi:hypothetical protein
LRATITRIFLVAHGLSRSSGAVPLRPSPTVTLRGVSGIRLDGDRLKPPREAKTVLVRDGEILVSDGPFGETKEVICGFDILECPDIDEAVKVAAAHPVATFGRIEVRPFWRA